MCWYGNVSLASTLFARSRLGSKRIIIGASCGGVVMDQLKELKRVQKENERLRRAVSALTLDKFILSEVAKGKF
tara:strand:- start:526 stop:747 length:222 start_codon:yes stop_codon:yes gene_type:complete